MLACTIAARRDLAAVRNLTAGFLLNHRHSRMLALILDATPSDDYRTERFEPVLPEQLRLERFGVLAAIHAQRALTAIACPEFLRFALGRSDSEPVLHLAPRTHVLASMEPLAERARATGFALVPRSFEPIPRDGFFPSELDKLRLGVIDPACLAVAPGERTEQLLAAWADAVEHSEGNDDSLVASRWPDTIPPLLEADCIVRDPGFAVSAWNLHERRVAVRGGGWFVDDVPLRSVDLTGLGDSPALEELIDAGDLADSELLRPGSTPPRRAAIRARDRSARCVASQPALQELIDLGERSRARHAEPGAANVAYGYDRLADGTRLTELLREAVLEAHRHGGLVRTPFEADGATDLFAWLNGPAQLGAAAGVTRFWFGIYLERPDLRVIHADLDGAGGSGFIGWIRAHGQREYGVPDTLMPPATAGLLQTA